MKLLYQHPAIVLVGGVPGSGKSRLLEQINEPGAAIIAADEVRGDIQEAHGLSRHAYVESLIPEARNEFFNLLDDATLEEKSIFVEAAYLSPHSRGEMTDWAFEHGYDAHLILVHAPFNECMRGVAQRKRTVPPKVVRRYYEAWLKTEKEIAQGGLERGLKSIVLVGREDEVEELGLT